METENPYYFENRFTPAIIFCRHLRSPTPESRPSRRALRRDIGRAPDRVNSKSVWFV